MTTESDSSSSKGKKPKQQQQPQPYSRRSLTNHLRRFGVNVEYDDFRRLSSDALRYYSDAIPPLGAAKPGDCQDSLAFLKYKRNINTDTITTMGRLKGAIRQEIANHILGVEPGDPDRWKEENRPKPKRNNNKSKTARSEVDASPRTSPKPAAKRAEPSEVNGRHVTAKPTRTKDGSLKLQCLSDLQVLLEDIKSGEKLDKAFAKSARKVTGKATKKKGDTNRKRKTSDEDNIIRAK